MKLSLFLLSIIVFIAVLFRFVQPIHGINPPFLTWDEVAWGYNAYSLGIDGKDEFGRFLPVNYLESFGDFKPPMYAYLDIIPVKIFGLNEFATRFPSAFFGSLTVLLTYFLTRTIFYSSKKKDWYGLGASFILAISPWHIMLSRAAFEANIATFFLVLGVWLFLEGVQTKKWAIVMSAISFVLSMYTFNTSRVVAPMLAIVLALFFWKKLISIRKHLILAILIGIFIFMPLFNFLLTPQAKLRFQEVNIFSDISVIEVSNQEIKNDNYGWWSKIIHNRRLLFAQSYLIHYFDNLSPSFLFIKGDGNPKFSTQDVGEMYIWDLPFFIFGILLLFRRREGNWFLLPVWLILGILPAATARETPHALRIETILPTMQIFTAYGVVNFLQTLKNLNKTLKISVFSILGLILAANVIYFLHGYMTHYPRGYSGEWQYGYKESINYVKTHDSEYDDIYITESLGRPYIYYLYYLRIPPSVFRKQAIIHRDSFGFVDVQEIGKYHFVKPLEDKKGGGRRLFIETPDNIAKSGKILKTFNLLDGTPALSAYTL